MLLGFADAAARGKEDLVSKHPLDAPRQPGRGMGYREFRAALTRAEAVGALSEFHALCFQGVLAMAEGSDFAHDYLEMADAVAVSPQERAVVVGLRTAYEQMASTQAGGSPWCMARLGPHVAALCKELLHPLGAKPSLHDRKKHLTTAIALASAVLCRGSQEYGVGGHTWPRSTSW